MNKRDYLTGMITGALIVIFLGACGACIWILFGMKNADNNLINQQLVSSTVSAGVAEGDSVLADEEFVEKMMYLENVIDVYYVDDVSGNAIQDGILDGMMYSLDDPYADYYTVEELNQVISSAQGVYYGIGAYLTEDQEKGYPMVTGIIKNSPAEDSDLCINDYICEVDGIDVLGMELSDVVALIKGEKGTAVTLTVVRMSTKEEMSMEIVRGEVETPTVVYEFYDDSKIAYIGISEFDSVTVEQFEEALAEADSDGMEGLIIDLRGNPGGSLDAVVDVAGQILPKGLVVYTEDKYGNRQEYTSDGKNELQVPLVVLVNKGSASASEILAGSIKDYGIGTIMGTTTYGKGIVQRIVGLPDGTAVKLTVSHYYTPLGNDIHKKGIEPDEYIEFDVDAYMAEEGYDNQLESAKEYLINQISN